MCRSLAVSRGVEEWECGVNIPAAPSSTDNVQPGVPIINHFFGENRLILETELKQSHMMNIFKGPLHMFSTVPTFIGCLRKYVRKKVAKKHFFRKPDFIFAVKHVMKCPKTKRITILFIILTT